MICPFVVPQEGLFSDSCGTFPYIFEILVNIWEIFEQISEIVRKIYGVFQAIFGIACKIGRVLQEMWGVSLPISRIHLKGLIHHAVEGVTALRVPAPNKRVRIAPVSAEPRRATCICKQTLAPVGGLVFAPPLFYANR